MEKRQALAKRNLPTDYEMLEVLPLTPTQQSSNRMFLDKAEKYTDFIDLTPSQRKEQIEKLIKEIELKPAEEKKETENQLKKSDIEDTRFEKNSS